MAWQTGHHAAGGNDNIWNLEKSLFIPATKKPEDYTTDYVQLQVFHKALFLKGWSQCPFPVPIFCVP